MMVPTSEVSLAKVSTRDLLGEYTVLLNRHGIDSSQASDFLEAHKSDTQFVQLAETARWLKKALTAPAVPGASQT